MRWDTVLPLWLGRIAANSDVQSVLGADGPNQRFYMAGERDHEVSSMEWTLISPGIEGEVYEVAQVQLDLWVDTDLENPSALTRLRTLESGVRLEAHHDLPITISGVELWSRMIGGAALPGAQSGILGHSLDFELEYLRAKWS